MSIMLTGFAALLVVHGLIHLLGFAKGFGLAELPQLRQPVSVALGVLWLLAAFLFMVTAISLFVSPRVWWIVASCAVLLSMIAIASSWADAKFGALANAIVVMAILFELFSRTRAA
jgi:hypothetical protein